MSRQSIYSWLKRKKTHATYFGQLQTVGCCKTLLLTACLDNQTWWCLLGAASVHLQKRVDGGQGLWSGSAHCPPYYCERREFYLLAGYYVFACLFSSVKPLQQLAPPHEGVAGRVAPCRRPVLVLEMLLLKNVNTGQCATCPCPRSDGGTSARRSSLTCQSSSMSKLQREKQRRRKLVPGPYAHQVRWDGDVGSPQLRFSLTGWSI